MIRFEFPLLQGIVVRDSVAGYFGLDRMSVPQIDQRRMIRVIMVALAAWGAVLSLGACLFGVDPETRGIGFSPNPWRGLIVLACAAAFLGFWNLLLFRRSTSSKGTK